MQLNEFFSIFDGVKDPRRDHGLQHRLSDILMIGIISVISGAETWNQMEEYALSKEPFLKEFLDLPNGIPSHDTLNRVFSSIDPIEFRHCFEKWVAGLCDLSCSQVIAIDGKSMRGTRGQSTSPVHLVSAWATANNLVLGQEKVRCKSNEITAIPELLSRLVLEGNIVTIDAMGCQQNIAKDICSKQADYILAVKSNQKELYEDVAFSFRGLDIDCHTKDYELDHGRIETRKCSVIRDLKAVETASNWMNLKSIVKVESHREYKNSDKKPEIATRYYISSLEADSKVFQKYIRSHWQVENKLHWTLDVCFSEDASRKRDRNAAENYAILNKIALNLLENDKSIKIGVKGKRLKAAWDNSYLKKILKL